MLTTSRLNTIQKIIQSDGYIGLIKVILLRYKKKILQLILSPLALVITFFVLVISRWLRVTFIRLASDRIGHYAWVTEQFLCARKLTLTENKKPCITLFYTNPGTPLSNTQLHRMWKRVITILPFPYLMAEVDRYLLHVSKEYRNDPLKLYFTLGDGYDRWNLLGKIPECHIDFTAFEKMKGIKIKHALGIPENAPYVCILGRDSLYLNIHMPNIDSSYLNYRNVDINNYKKAAEFLVNQGYYVIRMGKHVKDAFNMNHPQIIDYANSTHRSDFMDIYLSANCSFFISVGSGLDAIAQIFRRPLLITNFAFSRGIWPDWYLFMPKNIYDKNNGRYLSFKEIYSLLSNSEYIIPKLIQDRGLQFMENTPEEIRDAVKELLERLSSNAQYSETDEQLQQKFWQDYPNRFPENPPLLKIPVFIYTRMLQEGRLRIARTFLRNNATLLH